MASWRLIGYTSSQISFKKRSDDGDRQRSVVVEKANRRST